MHRVDDASRARRTRSDGPCMVRLGDQRLLAEDVEFAPERPIDELRMSPWRRADIDEVQHLAGEQVINAFVPAAVRTCFQKSIAE